MKISGSEMKLRRSRNNVIKCVKALRRYVKKIKTRKYFILILFKYISEIKHNLNRSYLNCLKHRTRALIRYARIQDTLAYKIQPKSIFRHTRYARI